MLKTFKIHPRDNITVILEGEKAGHKIALSDIALGEKVIKYGYPIGFATKDIKQGETVHTNNLKKLLSDTVSYTYNPVERMTSTVSDDSFQGYLRKNGQAGIRNELWIIPTVGCVSTLSQKIAFEAHNKKPSHIDGVYAFPHPYGCSQLGEDHKSTQKLLSSLIHHPNAGGVLVLGLGCENNRISELKSVLGEYDNERIKFLETQSVEDEIAYANELIQDLFSVMKDDKRTTVSVSKLKIGLKCGGSDGFSGITANPLVGRVSDILIKNGGTAILTEVPEMFGAETILMDRCKDESTFFKTVEMINSFKKYYIENNQPIYENPSPGNKDGGITTLEEKSLGCIQKSGDSIVEDVLKYCDRAVKTGLNLLYAPGNDLVASTALAACGAQIVLFTTGRGTPFGTAVPTVKISTNTPLFEKKSGWMDFNAGEIINGIEIDTLAAELYEYIKDIASGCKTTKNEQNGYREIAIFKTGVTL